jgi:hypothetical protein
VNDLIWEASLAELKAGYVETDDHYVCLCCGQQFEIGVIYPEDGVLYEVERYTRLHIAKEHGSVFEYLLSLDKSATGLSDVQRRLLSVFYQGRSDAEVQRLLGSGSTSTIRNHRFQLKEKERQARLFLAIMELLKEKDQRGHAGAARPAAGPRRFPRGEQQRRVVLAEAAGRFEPGRRYKEQEVNAVLKPHFEDHVLVRRLLVDHGFLDRLPDGSQYWRSEPADAREESKVDRRSELKRLAKEIKTEAGIYQIRNTRNGKLFVESTRNLKTVNGKLFALETGGFPDRVLQQEWNEFGKDAFVAEVLEVLEKPAEGYFDEADALEKLRAKWLEQLKPYGERGYHPLPEEQA